MAGFLVVAAVEGRFDDRLAADGPELLSATDLLLTTWDTTTDPPTITAEQRVDGRRPGPLIADGGRVAWGPALITGTVVTSEELVRVAVSELGEAAPATSAWISGLLLSMATMCWLRETRRVPSQAGHGPGGVRATRPVGHR
jgi:hypothetical protein